MYYNIKIKLQGSELSLECQNKDITQREMDLYFAHIFNIEELKLKVKKVEINNDSLKSISVLEEKTTEPEPIKETPKIPAKEDEIIQDEPQIEQTDNAINTDVQNIIEHQTVQEIQTPQDVNTQELPNTIHAVEIEAAPAPQNIPDELNNPTEIIPVNNEKQVDISDTGFEVPTPVAFKNEQPQITSNSITEIIKIQNNKSDEEVTKEIQQYPSIEQIENTTPIQEVETNKNEISEINITDIKTPAEEKIQTELPQISIQNQAEDDNKKDDLENFINQVQNEIDSMDISSNKTEGNLIEIFAQNAAQSADTSINTETNTVEFNLEEKEELPPIIDMQHELEERATIQTNNQTKLDSIFSDFTAEKKEDVSTQQVSEILNIEEDNLKINLADEPVFEERNIQEQFIEQPDQIQSEPEPFIQPQNPAPKPSLAAVFESISQPPSIPEAKPEPSLNVSFEQPQLTQNAQLDFSAFLRGFKTEELSDEFLICAFYIKNILKQTDFTMKFINSKLFQATGKIANMAIAEDLIKKDFIKIIETQDSKAYCITQDGESYFASKFQS